MQARNRDKGVFSNYCIYVDNKFFPCANWYFWKWSFSSNSIKKSQGFRSGDMAGHATAHLLCGHYKRTRTWPTTILTWAWGSRSTSFSLFLAVSERIWIGTDTLLSPKLKNILMRHAERTRFRLSMLLFNQTLFNNFAWLLIESIICQWINNHFIRSGKNGCNSRRYCIHYKQLNN